VIDEIHTPDSSRFWYSSTYPERFSQGKDPEAFDKEYVRRWLAERGYRGDGPSPDLPDELRIEAARRYIEACDAVRGAAFEPNLEPPIERIRKNLGVR
jgi:phosphoribosylaminoimidazole-succinocarboxamide synthase